MWGQHPAPDTRAADLTEPCDQTATREHERPRCRRVRGGLDDCLSDGGQGNTRRAVPLQLRRVVASPNGHAVGVGVHGGGARGVAMDDAVRPGPAHPGGLRLERGPPVGRVRPCRCVPGTDRRRAVPALRGTRRRADLRVLVGRQRALGSQDRQTVRRPDCRRRNDRRSRRGRACGAGRCPVGLGRRHAADSGRLSRGVCVPRHWDARASDWNGGAVAGCRREDDAVGAGDHRCHAVPARPRSPGAAAHDQRSADRLRVQGPRHGGVWPR